jgi:LysM repeat protein
LVDREEPFGYYSFRLRIREGNVLQNLIPLILLFFLASGCSSAHRQVLKPTESSLSWIEVRLSSLIIPDPPETPRLETDSAIEAVVIAQPRDAGSPFSKEEDIYRFETKGLFDVFGEIESDPPSAAEKEFPVLITENSHPQNAGPQAAAKKRILSHPKSPKAGGSFAATAPPPTDQRTKKIPENPQGESSSPPPLPTPETAITSSALLVDGKDLDHPLSRESFPDLPGSEKSTSLSSAANVFPSLLNDKVQEFISFFQGRAESFFSRSLARSQAYEEMMKKIFREKNLPEDLFYLALIESGYNPTALSRAKASGIWQFIAQTAKRFGLRVDKWVDERRDPEKSTLAAAEYLKTLHGLFNNWDLATASYNAGEGKLLAAMKKARSEDFWEISNHRYLKQETKKYVPMFLAAMTIAKEPQKYGFANIEYHPPLVYEKVAVPPSTSLALIAKAAESDLAEIRSLNPALLREKTPPNLPHFEVNLPSGKKEVFEKNFPSLSRSAASKNAYRVRGGDTLSGVAKKFNVGVQELCETNALRPNSLLKAGSNLRIPQ